MTLRLKFTHGSHSVHVQVPDLRPATIYARFSSEFPDALKPTSTSTAAPTLRWLDSDGDWIEIRRDDKDCEHILLQVVNKSGVVHIQSGFTCSADEPTTQLGTLMHRYEKVMDAFDHLSRTVVKLPPISNILIVTKPDPKLSKLTKELSVWLLDTFPGITLFVDKKLQGRSSFKYQEILDQNPSWEDRLQFWTKECQTCKDKQIHLAVTLGGDGTVLYTTWMFQQRVPPIVAFHLGSLGFLTNFCFDTYRPTMTNIIRGEGMNLNIRMRLQCSVYKYEEGPNIYSPLQKQPDQLLTANGLDAHSTSTVSVTTLTSSSTTADGSDDSDDDGGESHRQRVESRQKAEIMRRVKEMDSKRGTEVMDLGVCHEQGHTLLKMVPNPSTRRDSVSGIGIGVGGAGGEEMIQPTDTWQVLNEVTIDRGSNAGMLQLELFVDGNHVTTILADGLVIATATGSTAYSLSIGGSLIHPDKNSVIISPIAPHSLTARPMIIPGTKHLRVCVPAASRTTAWASFDGRHRQELGKGDSVMITASRYPAATICRRDQSTDWFTGLTQVLNWNSRVLQKPLESHL
ncbi:hypothetical protein BG015_009754 [Linnemannia schmuckeri]|uniref:PB1 domain-containing protein n=1 Tax=Linnemannia schmuckeri TaxID=64567 RepID=A0A9P5VET9_9FUNG|nr:hypothetical protein BG015_009754 [Linnemannia schmuckeri]